MANNPPVKTVARNILFQMTETRHAGDSGHKLDVTRTHAAGKEEEEEDQTSDQTSGRGRSHLLPSTDAEMQQ